MSWAQAIILGFIQGLTEFLPVSSSAHLRIFSEVFFHSDAGASFTAVTQLGTELAVLIYFAKDIGRLVTAWFRGLFNPAARGIDYRLAWYVVIGTLPIGILGYVFKDFIETSARNLWLIATTLIVFGVILGLAERFGRQRRELNDMTLRDGLIMGGAQALALIPGVSRSGATISGGLAIGLTREVATRYSFLLAIPAVVASGVFSLPRVFAPENAGENVLIPSPAQMVVATVIAFGVGYVTIAWLLRYVARHSVYVFVGYRILLGLALFGWLLF